MEQIIEEYGIGGILFVIGTGVLAGLGKVLQLIAGGIEYGSSGKRIRQCGTGCGGRSCVFWHAGTVFAVQTGIDYADDRGLGKRRLLMKELIRQYAGTAIAVVTALVLIALVSEMSVVVEKGIPKSRALCETDTAAFEGYWRSR